MMKNVSPKEVKVDPNLYKDYGSNERTIDTTKSPTSDNRSPMSDNSIKEVKKDELDFDNCEVFLKKPTSNTRQRSAYKFLEESFNGQTGQTSQMGQTKTINQNMNQKSSQFQSTLDNKSIAKGINFDNPDKNNDKTSSDLFMSRRKNKVTKTLDNNDFEF